MFCQKCGKEIQDDADVCIHCGHAVNKNEPSHAKDYKTPKTAIGVLLGFFLGLIGLIIGVLMYPEGTVARKTFIKSWGITYAVTFAIEVLLIIIYAFVVPRGYYY